MGFRVGRRPLIGAVLAGSMATLVGCSTSGSGSGASSQAHNLVIGTSVAPNALDPSTNSAAAIPQALLYNVYETLVKLDNNGAIKPLLATKWEQSDDGLTYTFNLQPQAKFASGAAVDANAVKTSFDRVMTEPKITSAIKQQIAPMAAVNVKDPTTVDVVLSQRSNNWLYYMAQAAGIVYDPTKINDIDKQPAGSGPFEMKEWHQNELVTLKRAGSYWGTPTKFDEVTFKSFTDPNAENAAMSSGDLDIISNVQAPQALSQFNDTSKYTILDGTTNSEVVMGFNHQKDAFQDIRVRQAINYAINRGDLLKTVAAGHGTLIGSMVPPTDPWYEDLSNTYGYDPDKARQLLKDAGHENNLTLALRVPTLPYATASATFVASALKDVGITVNVDQLDFTRWIDEVMTKSNYDLTIVGHAEGRDIIKWAEPGYYWHYNNPDFQKLIAEAETGPSDEQVGLMKQAARILATDAVADFLYLLANLVVTRADLEGVPKNLTSSSFDITSISSKNF
ncbi:ABC transporter substrate-binding protein [Propionibacterium freudenreichii]|uniref:ABC transporter substrate-binding protein n=1 Tax=Propionibacterium freudenreichii TaxID=1744 RepID=UPI00254DDEAC|nr:ABC transporter substrate-binding protein [Propionibacterium freudenreichii]MDK9657355.1 ABC transporter substrate-binding protein [Propionibacterium freudenreichii]